MAFDCMAIGVGLFASVMATWNPNEQFSYGYLPKFMIHLLLAYGRPLGMAESKLYLDSQMEYS